jgi:hypothetical protein
LDSGDSKFEVRKTQSHYQSIEHNSLFGGISRVFEPIEPSVMNSSTMLSILSLTRRVTDSLLHAPSWSVELHQFRIEATASGRGDPTPEGMHRDGVDYVHILLVSRYNVRGGATMLNGASNKYLASHLLNNTFDMLVLDDHRVQHSVEPISCLDPTMKFGHRDVLVLTYKSAASSQSRNQREMESVID